MPDIGVEAPEVRLEDAVLPFVTPLDVPFVALPTAAGFLDHGVGAGAFDCVFGGPNAGKASSEFVSKAGLLGAVGCACSRIGCLPAAFEDMVGSADGVATREGSVLIGKEVVPCPG